MKIFLIGFMGCGKTTLGKKLAAKMGYDFIDLDHQLEAEAGMTVRSYFEQHGEDAFRELERQVLRQTVYPVNCIVATGGGTPCYFDNMEFMNHTGITIYIELSALALAKRLEHGRHKRPLLKDLTEEEVIKFIEDKLGERNTYYLRSFVAMSGINISPEKVRAQLFQIY